MNAIDGYLQWLTKGGAGRIVVGLVLPVVLVVSAVAAVLSGGNEPADATAPAPLAAVVGTIGAAPTDRAATSATAIPATAAILPATTTPTEQPAATSTTAPAPIPTATSAPPPATATSAPALPVATVAATSAPAQRLVASPAIPATAVPTQTPRPAPTATAASAPPTATSAPATGAYRSGNAYNCSDFPNYAAAKAYFDAVPGDPSKLDSDHDGIPCESLAGAP